MNFFFKKKRKFRTDIKYKLYGVKNYRICIYLFRLFTRFYYILRGKLTDDESHKRQFFFFFSVYLSIYWYTLQILQWKTKFELSAFISTILRNDRIDNKKYMGR